MGVSCCVCKKIVNPIDRKYIGSCFARRISIDELITKSHDSSLSDKKVLLRKLGYENHSKPKIRPTTQETYESRIRLHIIPEIGSIPLNKLTQNDLQQCYGRIKKSGRKRLTDKYGEGLSDRMVRMCHATCRSALEKAVQDGLIRMNPDIGCKLPPKKAREMQVLTREELQRFLIQAKFEGYYEVFLLDLATGLRRGELMALQWNDLNFKTGVLNF